MAMKKRTSQKQPTKKPTKPKKKPTKSKKKQQPRNPFDGKDPVLIKPAEKTYIEPHSGEVFTLWIDPSGMSSGWVSTGQYVPLGTVPQPPSVGSIAPELIERLKASPKDDDSILAASAISVANSNAIANAGMKDRYVDALVSWQKNGRRGPQPGSPLAPEMDPAKWAAGVNYYRPANFAFLYDWMKTHHSGRADQDPNAAIQYPPEVEYNQG